MVSSWIRQLTIQDWYEGEKNWKVEEISPFRSPKDGVLMWCCFHGGPVNNLTCKHASQFTIAKWLINLENQNMELKCLLETRGESFCSEKARALGLIKLSDCRSNIDDQLQTWHFSQLIGSIQEFEIILNRLGLPHDLSPEQLEGLWICEKNGNHFGKNWRPWRTCQYPLHSGRQKQLKTRNAVSPDMSREITGIYGKHVPAGSRKSEEL